MSRQRVRRGYLPAESEAAFQQKVCQFASYTGWALQYHTHDARRSAPGFPDLVLIRAPEVLFIELKTDKGRVRPDQAVWMSALADCGLETHLWRPADWPAIEERLSRPREGGR